MKKLIPFFAFILLASTKLYAQQNMLPSELILSITTDDKVKTIPFIVELVQTVPHARAVAYCSDFRVLLIRLNSAEQNYRNQVMQKLKDADILFEERQHATIEQVLNESKEVHRFNDDHVK